MEDAIGNEINDGDLILEIDPHYSWNQFGVVHGGLTPTGRVRYITPREGKRNAKECAIIKVSRQFVQDARDNGRQIFEQQHKDNLFRIQDEILRNNG
jgi:ribosomal protein S30